MPKDFYGIRADSISDAFSIAAANSLLSEMKQMLDDGHDVNAIARYCGGTALHTAAGLALIRSVEFLIGNGADLNATDKNDLTPLMNACSTGKVKGSQVALRLIAAGADVIFVRAADETTALKFAAKSCIDEVLQALIAERTSMGRPEQIKPLSCLPRDRTTCLPSKCWSPTARTFHSPAN